MSVFNNLDYNNEKIITEFFDNQNHYHRLTLSKSLFAPLNKDQYFLKMYTYDYNGNYTCQGYTYFYLDDLNKTSIFIGAYIKPEFRGQGISSYLIANWINICANEGYTKLATNKSQKKPFLLYLLKTFGFEIDNVNQYSVCFDNIFIYRNFNDKEHKYVLFKSPSHAKYFENSKVYKNDNYVILNPEHPNMSLEELKKISDSPALISDRSLQFLDQVLLSREYTLQDENKACQRVLKTKNKYRK